MTDEDFTQIIVVILPNHLETLYKVNRSSLRTGNLLVKYAFYCIGSMECTNDLVKDYALMSTKL